MVDPPVPGGPTCIVGPGLVAQGTVAPGSGGSAGRVSVRVPGGVWVAGSYECADQANWTVTVDSGAGAIGGVQLASEDFSGTITSAQGVVSSTVAVAVRSHPRIVPEWEQTATLRVDYVASSLRGSVRLTSSRSGSSVDLGGSLEANGSYRLAGRGVVDFAGSTIPLRGDYWSIGYAGAPRNAWSISGVGPSGTIDGVPVLSPSVTMTQDRPGVTGAAVLSVGAPEPIPVRTQLTFVDDDNWTLTSTGSPTATWQPASIPGLTVDSAAIAGTVTSTSGDPTWALAAGMTLVDERLSMRGMISLIGPRQWRISVSEAAGSILGVERAVDARSVTGEIIFDAGSVTGTVQLAADGDLLVDLPSGWMTSTDLTITFAKVGDGVIAVSKTVDYSMVNGDSRLALSGEFESSSSFELSVSGAVSFSGTAIPFGGYYRSAGYDAGDGPLAEPAYSMSGSVAAVPGGRVPLGGGAAISAGSLRITNERAVVPAAVVGPMPPAASSKSEAPPWLPGSLTTAPDETGAAQATAANGPSLSALVAATSTQEFTGQMDVQLSGNDSFSLAATVQYTDADDWLLTVDDTEGEPWSPFPGLTVPPQAFTGTVRSAAGVENWSVTVDSVEWSNLATGVNLVTSFELSDQCPLESNCTDSEGIYVGFTDGALDFPGDVPDMSLTGAFLTDASWARFDAVSDDLVFDELSVTDVELAMWKGERGDQYDDRLEMPDLSAENNSFNIEFCGKFQAEVPDVATVNTGGCVEWTPDGVVMAQVGMGGDVDSGEANGVSIGNTTLTGYAWTDLTAAPTVVLDGEPVELVENRHHLTAEMDIPADLMKAVGAGDDPATIDASGWFSDEGDFNLDAVIEVSMKSSGFTLEGISVHIGKDGNAFSLGLGADATVSVSGNRFPVSAFVGVEAGGGSSEIVVRLTAKGAVNEQKGGSFDVASLLPTGNFEPESPNTVDGSFDAKPDKNMLDDGDFEGSLDARNLVTNPDFETGIQDNLLSSGDFESGTTGNLMPNNDLEDTDVLVNGDFEEGTTGSWSTDPNFSATVTGSAESPSTAPTTDQGLYSTTLKHTSGSATSDSVGMSQRIKWAPVVNASYNFSVWAKSPDSTSGKLSLAATQEGSGSGCTSTSSNTFTVGSTWTKYTLSVTGLSCRTSFNLAVGAPDAGDSVMVDAATFQLISSPTTVELPASVERPALLSRFDTLPPISKAADVSFDANTNALRSDGNGSWWYFNPDSYGVA
ncbi:MAG: carbohydrate binding domain-containing protein, partial [Microthrixaceae bacterium]